jgi:hypothetical protein
MIERREFDVLVVVNPRVELSTLVSIVQDCEQAGIVVTRFAVQWQGVHAGSDSSADVLAYETSGPESASLQ